MSQGEVVESGKTIEVMRNPQHKMTQKLMMSQNFQLK
jgi:cationic peptide transport system ATP-binding protein